MNRLRRLGLALMLAAIAFAAWGLPAAADGQPTPAQTRLLVTADRAETQGQLLLSAGLTTAAGKPLSNRTVTFYRQAEFFGTRQVYLGTATTDGTGQAALPYSPSQPGHENIKVVFAGDPETAGSAAALDVEIDQATPALGPEPAPLAALGGWLAQAAGVLTAAFWMILLGVFLRTVLGIRGAGSTGRSRAAERGTVPEPEPATITQEGVYGAS